MSQNENELAERARAIVRCGDCRNNEDAERSSSLLCVSWFSVSFSISNIVYGRR